MIVRPGETLSHYRLVEKIGEGGMGVVWKAIDTNLDRDVAIKILPDEFAADPTRLARFEREAKLLASLSHPCIATVHSIEEADGIRFLVMELVEGEDLAQRLARGAMPAAEAVELAIKVAAALEAAHDSGVIHRDLKPANIRLTPDGRVKVLDFGLAKALAPPGVDAPPGGRPSLSPTMTATGTAAGLILGTAGYMSPEQARGRPVDRRTDLWSFGVVLYEALTGRTLFQGETVTDSIGAILHKEPDWSALPRDTPAPVRHLLRRCLHKDRERRLRDAGDARIELEGAWTDPIESGSGAARPGAPGRSRWLPAAALLLVVAAGVAIGWSLRGTSAEPVGAPTIGFSFDLSGLGWILETYQSNLALDPRGTMLAIAARRGEERQIFVRPLESSGEARPVAGTEGGGRPFFSPDGRWLGFIRDGKLMKVPAGGGPALTICERCASSYGFADPLWLDDGTIVFCGSPPELSLKRIDPADGTPMTLAKAGLQIRGPGRDRSITGFDSPARVPGQPYVLASVYFDVTIEDYAIVAVSLKDGSVRSVLSNATEPRFMPPGHLLFSRESSLFAAPFDPRRGVVTGESELVVDGVLVNNWADNAQYAVANNGTLAYVPGSRFGPGRSVIRVDRDGRTEALLKETDALLGDVRVSPDGGRLILSTIRRRAELWTFDLERRSFDLVTNIAPSYQPIWMPDGLEVLYLREGYGGMPSAIVRQALDEAGDGRPVERLTSLGSGDSPLSVSPDGEYLILQRLDPEGRTRSDILVFRLGEEGGAEPLVATPANEDDAVFSPDGRWIAYESDESGREEVYVRRFPDGARRWQVSIDGGEEPRWSRDGTRLYFGNNGALFESRVRTGEGFSAERPVKLFDWREIAAPATDYDLLPDGSFVMIQPAPWEKEPRRIEVVVHWDGRPRPGFDSSDPP